MSHDTRRGQRRVLGSTHGHAVAGRDDVRHALSMLTCAQAIIVAGIRHFIYDNEYRLGRTRLLESSGVAVIRQSVESL